MVTTVLLALVVGAFLLPVRYDPAMQLALRREKARLARKADEAAQKS